MLAQVFEQFTESGGWLIRFLFFFRFTDQLTQFLTFQCMAFSQHGIDRIITFTQQAVTPFFQFMQTGIGTVIAAADLIHYLFDFVDIPVTHQFTDILQMTAKCLMLAFQLMSGSDRIGQIFIQWHAFQLSRL
eukprot:RCo004080